jgi:hypothetical protein
MYYLDGSLSEKLVFCKIINTEVGCRLSSYNHNHDSRSQIPGLPQSVRPSVHWPAQRGPAESLILLAKPRLPGCHLDRWSWGIPEFHADGQLRRHPPLLPKPIAFGGHLRWHRHFGGEQANGPSQGAISEDQSEWERRCLIK